MYLCICHAVTVAEVRQAAEAGLRDFDALVARYSLGDDDSCGTCLTILEELLNETAPACAESTQQIAGTRCQSTSQGLACAGTTTQGGIE